MQLPSSGTVRWLYLDLNSYFASVEQQLRPELRAKPIAVVPVEADTTCCIAASYEAKRYGVATGTEVREAKRLCPEIIFVLARQEQYAAFHHRIVDAVSTCIPVERVLSVDEMACRLTGPRMRHANAHALARQIKVVIHKEVGEMLRGSIGLGPNQLLAKIASDMQKPDGLTLLDASDLPGVLESLHLRDIPGIGPRMEIRLRRQGIQTMTELCALTAKQLRGIWGSVIGERYWYWMRGYDFDGPVSLTQSIGHQHVLAPKFRTPELAAAVARKLMYRAAARLRCGDLWARGLSVYQSFSQGREKRFWECHTKIMETQDVFTLLEFFNRMWASCPSGNPTFVGVELYDLVPEGQHTPSLFPEEAPRTRLAHVMDSVRERFGPQALYLAGSEAVCEAAPAHVAFSSIPNESEFTANAPASLPKKRKRHVT